MRQARKAARQAWSTESLPPKAHHGPTRCAFAARLRQSQRTDRHQGCDLRRDRRGSRTVLYLADSPQQLSCDPNPSSAPALYPHERMEVPRQASLETPLYSTPNRFDESSIDVPQRLKSSLFAAHFGSAARFRHYPEIFGLGPEI